MIEVMDMIIIVLNDKNTCQVRWIPGCTELPFVSVCHISYVHQLLATWAPTFVQVYFLNMFRRDWSCVSYLSILTDDGTNLIPSQKGEDSG